jgi:hypothetical protein
VRNTPILIDVMKSKNLTLRTAFRPNKYKRVMKKPKPATVAFQPSEKVTKVLDLADKTFGNGMRSKLINQTLERGLRAELQRMQVSLGALLEQVAVQE